MKILKRILCFVLIICTVISTDGFVQAFTIGDNGKVSSSSAGSASCGPSGEAWGYVIGFAQPEFKTGVYWNESAPEDVAEFQGAYLDFACNNYVTVNTRKCLLVQLDGADYSDSKIMADDKSLVSTKHNYKKSPTNDAKEKVNPWAKPVIKYFLSLGDNDADRYAAFKKLMKKGNYKSLVKEIKKNVSDVPTTSECRDSVVAVLQAGNRARTSLSYFSGKDFGKKLKEGTEGEQKLYNKFDKNTTKNPDHRGESIYRLAILGAYLTVAYAIDIDSTHGYVDKYMRICSTLEPRKDLKSVEFPVITINSVMPFFYGGKRWWATVPHFMSWLMNVGIENYTDFDRRYNGPTNFVRDYPSNWDVLEMTRIIHKYMRKDGKVKKRSSGCKCHGGNKCMRFCTNRMFNKQMMCDDSKLSKMFKDSTGKYHGTQMCGVKTEKMYGTCFATSWLIIDGANKSSIKYLTSFELSDPASNEVATKEWADKEGYMENHPLYLKDVLLSFDEDKSNMTQLNKFLKENNYKDNTAVKVKFDVYRKEYTKMPKKLTDKADLKDKAEQFTSQSADNIFKMGSDTTKFISTTKCKYSVTLPSGTKKSNVSTVNMTVADLKAILTEPDKYPFTIKTDKITNDFLKNPTIGFRYALMGHVQIGSSANADAPFHEVRDVKYYWNKDKDDEEPEPVTYISQVATPYAELKCGSVTDSGANEPFEAMAGFPTTRDIYFASGGSEYVVQITYDYVEGKNGKRAYTQPTNTQLSALTIPYQKQTGASDSPTPGAKPAPLEATCPDCGAKVKTEWFPFRVQETKWDWKAVATATCPGHPGPDNTTITHTANATTSKSDSATPGPPAIANCEGTVVSVDQSKVKATRWNWEWRNYGHANSYLSTDAESLPYTDNITYTNSRVESPVPTQNGKYNNTTTTVSNASESCVMTNTDKSGIMSYITSWDQEITDFNYAKITDCKVWKLAKSKCKGTYDLVEQDEITATVQTTDDSDLYNAAAQDTAKDGRFWHSEHTKEQDEYKFTVYQPRTCEFCVAHNAGKDLEGKHPETIINNTYCISDYLVLRTTKGDLSLIEFEYDCKNTTIPIGTIKFSGGKKGGTFSLDSKPVPFTAQNSLATYKNICLDNPMCLVAIDLKPDDITYGGYNGSYSSPGAKYLSSSGFTENIDITSLKINDPNYGKYKKTERPSPVYKLVQNYDVPDTTVRNGLYMPEDSYVFYKNIINYGSEDPIPGDIEPQEEFEGELGFTLPTTYSPEHTKINDVIVHDPVSTQYAMIVPLDPSRDQRTTSSLVEDEFHNYFPGECSGDASTCQYSHLKCTYDSKLYHDANCYDTEEVGYVIREDVVPETAYTSNQTIQLKSGGRYTIKVYGKADPGSTAGKVEGVYRSTSDKPMDITFTDDGIKVSVKEKGVDKELISVTNGVVTQGGWRWNHSYYWGDPIIHFSTSPYYCTVCNKSTGTCEEYVDGTVANGTATFDEDNISASASSTTGTEAKVLITQVIPIYQQVLIPNLTCGEVHHAPNTNWRYYVSNWETSTGMRSNGYNDPRINVDKIRPLGSTISFVSPSDIKDKFVLVRTTDGEYKLGYKDNPYIDPTNGQPWSLATYSLDGVTENNCIWNLTDNDNPAYDTRTATSVRYHNSFGDSTCWEACHNDKNHQDTHVATIGGKTYNSGGDFLNLDYGFQIYYPNIGNFYGNGAYGISDVSPITGRGYTTPMDTTEWLKYKYVILAFDVIYDKDGDGDFSDDTLYLAGDPIPLGTIGADGKFVDDRPGDYLYNFYIPLEQDEVASACVGFYAVAINNEADEWCINTNSHNYDRDNYSAQHDAMKANTIDVVGRIGGLTMLDTGDFRYANLFKKNEDGWLVDNIVHKVDYAQQNYFMADPVTLRGEVGSPATNGLNTYGTQHYKNDLSKLLKFPLVPDKNNIDALKKQPQRVGYMNYMSLETAGNYYGENQGDDDTYKTQITPFYYHLDLTTGKWTPVDVYMLVGTKYKRIAEFGSDSAITDHEWLCSLNWQEEHARRMYTNEEKEVTDKVIEKLVTPEYKYEDGELVAAYKRILMPSGTEYCYGTANRLFLKDKNRTFVGTSLTESTDTNPGKKVPEEFYSRNGQRWHFSMGLPSSAVFVEKGQPCSEENIKSLSNNHSVVVCAADILSKGSVWTLKYDGVPTSDQMIKVLPTGKTYTYADDPDGPGDKQIITVYTTNKSSKDDLNVEGTH